MTASIEDDASLVFGASLSWARGAGEVLAQARAAERAGFDLLTAADHLGNTSPFAVLAAAAAVTSRIRLRTYTLDSYFWNPALLAREVATLDLLSGGRFELGLGAGHMRHEHEDAGLPFPPIAERAALMGSLLDDVRARLAGSAGAAGSDRSAGSVGSFRPAGGSVPILVGAWGSAGLAVAAHSADLIGLTGMVQIPGAPAGTFRTVSAAETDAKLAELAALPRERPDPPVLDALLQQVVVDRDPEMAAAELVQQEDGRISVADLLDSPFFLYAPSPAEGLAELHRRRARWGIRSWCTHGPSVPALAQLARSPSP